MVPSVELKGDKVCMVMANTAHNQRFVEMGQISFKVNLDYCRRHGYAFRGYTSGFAEDRHPSWSKLLFVREAVKEYPWVMWVDVDAVMTNHGASLDRFLDDRYMMIVGKQVWNMPPANNVNLGVFLARKDPFLERLFDETWADISRPGRVGWEQDGIRRMIEVEPFKSRVKLVCRRDFNSLVEHESLGLHSEFNRETEAWHKGDLVAHYGWRREDVVEAMKATLLECGMVV